MQNRLWGTQAQSSQCGDSVLVAHGLSCPSACEIFPDQRFESVSPALAGRMPTAGPPGKSPGKLLSVGNYVSWGFPGSSAGKESACNAGDLGLIPGLGRSSGGGHGNPLQYSCLETPHGQRSLVGYSPWGRKGQQLSTAKLCISSWLHKFLLRTFTHLCCLIFVCFRSQSIY